MKISNRLTEITDRQAWNHFVDQHPLGTVFHKTTWLELIDPDIEILAIMDEAVIIAGVALLKTKKNKVTGYHIPPYTQYFSPLYHNSSNKQHSLTEEHLCITEILSGLKHARHIDFKLPRGHQSILPYHWKGFESAVSITHVITGTLDDYLKGLNKNKLRELKKLQGMLASGELTIETEINEKDLQFLFKQTEERKGFDGNSELAVRLILKAGDDIAKKTVIRSKSHGLLAFGFFPYDKHGVYNLVNASVRIADPVLKTINLLLLYQAIEFALTTGRIFDFEGSMLPGVETFCRLMGGIQAPVYRVQKSPALMYSVLRAAKHIKNDRTSL